MTQAAAGWYPQPDGTQRYWDGSAWTEHIAPGAALATPPAPPGPPALAALPVPPAPSFSGYAALPSQEPLGVASAKPRRRVWPWVVGIGGGVLLVIIGLAVWAFLALVGVIKGPVDTVNAFNDAVNSGDCAAINETVTTSTLASAGWNDCVFFKADAKKRATSAFTVTTSSASAEAATAKADVQFEGDPTTRVMEFYLVKENGGWRVESFGVEAQ